MAQQIIDNGTTAGDGTGENLHDAFEKVNDNFTEVYTGNFANNITANTINSISNNTEILGISDSVAFFSYIESTGITEDRNMFMPDEHGTLATREWVEGNSVTNATTTALSESDLNTAYPSAVNGFKVYALDIIAGALLYTKISTSWVSQPLTIVS